LYGGQNALIYRCLFYNEQNINFLIYHSFKNSQFQKECKKTGIGHRLMALHHNKLIRKIDPIIILFLIKFKKISVVHVDSFSTAYPLALFKCLFLLRSTKLVFTIRSDRPTKFKIIDKFLLNYIDSIVTNSEYNKRTIQASIKKEVSIHYSPINFDNLKLLPTAEEFNLGYLGSIEPRKNLLFLIKAIKTGEIRNNPKLYIAGEAKNKIGKEYLSCCIKEAGELLNQKIYFLGYKKPVDFAKIISILVCPFKNEPLGRVVPEFLYMGRQVVVNDTGGLFEASLGFAHIYQSDNIRSFIKCINSIKKLDQSDYWKVQEKIKTFYDYKRLSALDLKIYSDSIKTGD